MSVGQIVLVAGAVVATAWGRIPVLPGTIDLTEVTTAAPILFRGRVVSVTPGAVARFQVDRWYRGQGGPDVSLHCVPYDQFWAGNGHYCIDFKLESHWLVFAQEKDGQLELVHDCEGAVEVSRFLGPVVDGGVGAQMEADFVAGLEDPDVAGRIFSIQRLGGLMLPSSRPALHRMIDGGTEAERNWAIYATLRTGDASVLPSVLKMAFRRDAGAPLYAVAAELRRLKDRSAIAGLIEIADKAPDPGMRASALGALGWNMRAPEVLPTLAAHLVDPDPGVRYWALAGVSAITKEPACAVPIGPGADEAIDAQIDQCRAWWERSKR